MISDKAIVDPCTYIDASVTIGPFTVIYANVEIGKNTKIGSHCVIGSPPEHRSHLGSNRSVFIGQDCFVGNHAHIDRGTVKDTIIENGVFILSGAQIGHDAHLESQVTVCGNSIIAGHAYLMRGCTIGQNSGVAQHCVIGSGTMISQGTHVSRDISPGRKIIGIIAKDVGDNPLGQRRLEFTDHQMAQEKERYLCLISMNSPKT